MNFVLFFIIKNILLWVMLTSVFRVLIKNLVIENFYKKKKKKAINVLITYFIFYKNNVKIFLK